MLTTKKLDTIIPSLARCYMVEHFAETGERYCYHKLFDEYSAQDYLTSGTRKVLTRYNKITHCCTAVSRSQTDRNSILLFKFSAIEL